ncbi:SCO2400 family protein [Streptomyces lincolnensis]|uniref:SCO2400 family protein n=1 Tax=Streptomyces lincolnensis TaxID=1915 RepID=UPI0037CDADBB
MDYCHPCRRHLNGALACPGCGATIDQIRADATQAPAYAGVYDAVPYAESPYGAEQGHAPYESAYGAVEHADGTAVGAYDGAGDREVAESAPVPAGGGRAARRRARGRGGRAAVEPELSESSEAYDDLDGSGGSDSSEGFDDEDDLAEAGGGASRRDRKAAAHRRRRRRVLLVVAAAVLAAGGLSLAELGMDAPGSAPRPAVAGDESAEGGTSSEADASTRPSPGADGKSDGASDKSSPSNSPSPSASASPDDDKDKNKPSPSASPTDGTVPGTSPTTPGASDPTRVPTPTADPPNPDPTPEPSPSPTCERFLWWCT